MADVAAQPTAALKAMEREYKSKTAETTALFENLFKLLAEKEKECENLKFDLQDQIESRRHWHKRATDAEARFASVQHVLVLVDGNQTFFNTNLIRQGIHGTRNAIAALVREAKDQARAQHKNDLPENISVMINIFVDVGKLADDLSNANLLPDPDQLWTFIQDASKVEPGLMVSDCGADHRAVDAKMKHFYELYLENCHCRHLFLALGRECDYYQVLSTYADDEYTRLKTTLVNPSQGLPEQYSLPFHTVQFSSLESVRRQTISFNKSAPTSNGTRFQSATLSAVAPKFSPGVAGAPPNDPVPKPNGARPPPAESERVQVKAPSTNGTSSANGRSVEVDARFGQSQATSIMPAEQAAPSSRPPPSPSISEVPVHVAHKLPEESQPPNTLDRLEKSSSAAVVKLDTSSHSSHQSNHGAGQSWETATDVSYLPPPITVPWGEEQEIAQAPVQPADQQPGYARRNYNSNRRQPKQGGGGGGGFSGGGKPDGPFTPQGARRGPKQFNGSWDDMVASEGRKASTQGSSTPPRLATVPMTPSATSKSTDFAHAFKWQVVTRPEPYPQARPVRAPIALNKLAQRLDLKLPRPAPADEAAFKMRTNNRHLCNEQHMRGSCADVKCPFDHEEISDGVYLALRTKARHTPCNQGSGCRRHDCYLAHHCPNVSRSSACGRPNCPFARKGLHDILDLDIVEMIEPTSHQEVLLEGLF